MMRRPQKMVTLDTHDADMAWRFRNHLQQKGVYAICELTEESFSGVVEASTDMGTMLRLYHEWRLLR